MTKSEIGEKLRYRRVFLKLRQEELAEMAGTNTKTIFQYESGQGNPSLDTLQRIADVLGLEISLDLKRLTNERGSI